MSLRGLRRKLAGAFNQPSRDRTKGKARETLEVWLLGSGIIDKWALQENGFTDWEVEMSARRRNCQHGSKLTACRAAGPIRTYT